MKHGAVCLVLPSKPFKIDLTVCVDVSSNPGPEFAKKSRFESVKLTADELPSRLTNTTRYNYSGIKPSIERVLGCVPLSMLFQYENTGSLHARGKLLDVGRDCTTADKDCSDNNGLAFKFNTGPVCHRISSIVSKRARKLPLSTRTRNPGNVINVHCSNYLPLNKISERPLSLCLFNAQSIRNKSADFIDYVCECKADLFAITETWLSCDDDAVRAEVCPSGYKLVDHPRVGRRGGGTALLYRDSFIVKKANAGEKKSFEFSEWTVKSSSSHSLRVIILYRPPYSEEHKISLTTFFVEFSEFLESILLSKEQLLIMGDFNIHVDVADDIDSIKFLDLLESVCLQQHVVHPTHIRGHTLDLIITRKSDRIINVPPYVGRYLSDHVSLLCSLHADKPTVIVKNINYRKMKSINLESLNNDLAASELCQNPPDDLDGLVACYNNTLKTILDKHAPLITKTIVERVRVPWFNDEIKIAKRQRRKAEKKWRATKLDSDLAAFKTKRNTVTFLMNKARREFYTNFIEENSGDQRKLFNNCKRLLNPTSVHSFPLNIDSEAFVNDIGRYFVRKIVNIRRRLDDAEDLNEVNVVPTMELPVTPFSEFEKISESTVKLLISSSSLKSCPLDPMPSKLVSRCDVLVPVLTRIINSSLEFGHFPEIWKEALVYPLLKKLGLDFIFKNFRPVSNLSFVSKLTERAVFDQTHVHMSTNNLYPTTQSSYRKNHSTETALLKVKSDILMNMNKQHVTLLVLLDLSSAFDTVDHDIMLNRLSSKIGMSGIALAWFHSYLSGRSQRVSVNGCISEKFSLDCGVPQGSCLGPLLFTIYVSKLFDIIKGQLPDVHCYADDTQLYISFSPNNDAGQTDAVAAIECCIRNIKQWMTQDKLLLNDDKTEFLIIGTKQQLAKVNIDHITIGNSDTVPQSYVKNLGVWFDENLSMNTHITKTSSAAFYHLFNIRRIRKYLSKETTETLVHAFISSRVDYCNSLLYGLPSYQLNKLQRVQNAACRLVFQESKYCHITPFLRELHWLPVKYRIDFKILLLTFKAIHGLAPLYIQDFITIKEPTNYSLRSNNALLLMPPNCKTLVTLGDRSFYVAAPKLWNSLPCFIRNCVSINSFKGLIKSFLFKKAFS